MISPGMILGGKYEVERVIGEGGMGVVVAAKHAQLGHRVAIKMMLGEALRNADARARFEREARAAAELASEHVARVTDVGHFDDGVPFMVMEFLEGEDLAARILRDGPLPIGDVLRMFIQACIGLGDAHERGIVHRDIKPSNLFLAARRGGRSTLKVLDFGIAKANLTTSDHQLTRTSALMGSPQYMSPEQLRDTKNVDARTDMWSLGASVYEALTGTPAFPAETLAELHVKILMDSPVPTFVLRPDVPAEFDAVVMRCLEKQSSQRFSSMQALQDALEMLERALAAPRDAFRSNPSLVDTALPPTEEHPAFVRTGAARQQSYAVAAGHSGTAPGIGAVPPAPRAGPPEHAFGATFTATDNPIAQTMGDLQGRGRKVSLYVAAAGAAAVVAVALVAFRLVTGGGSSAAHVGEERGAPAVAAPGRPTTRAVVVPAQAGALPPASAEPAAPIDTATTVPTDDAAPLKAERQAGKQGSKRTPGRRGGKASADVPAAVEEAIPAPEPPKPKKRSALDVELD